MPNRPFRLVAALPFVVCAAAGACVSDPSNPNGGTGVDASTPRPDAGAARDAAPSPTPHDAGVDVAVATVDAGADVAVIPAADSGPDASCATHAATWTKRVGTTTLATLWGTDSDALGNAYFTGQFPGSMNFGTTPLAAVGLNDLPLAKVDASGNELWAHVYSPKDQTGTANAQGALSGQAISVGSGGDIAVTGYYRLLASFGTTTLTTTAVTDLDGFVASFDSAGNARWAVRFGDAAQDRGAGVAVDAAGNVFLAGTFQGTIDLGNGPLTSRSGTTSTVIAKLNRAGVAQWSKVWNGIAVSPGGVKVDAAGNVYIAGQATEAVDFGGGVRPFGGSTDMFIAKLTTAGAHVYSNLYGDAAAQRVDAFAVSAAGEVVLGAIVSGTVDVGSGAKTGEDGDLFVAKLGATGNGLWSNRYGAAGFQQMNGVAVDASGSIGVIGTYTGVLDFGNGVLPTPATANGAIYFAHIGATGALDWAGSYAGATSSQGLRTAGAGGGAFFVTGLSDGAVDFCGHGLTSTVQLPFIGKLSP